MPQCPLASRLGARNAPSRVARTRAALLVPLALVAISGACAGDRQWRRLETVTESEMARERSDCSRAAARSLDPVGGKAGMYMYNTAGPDEIEASCLQAKGWVRVR
jgi:hypothetical protein